MGVYLFVSLSPGVSPEEAIRLIELDPAVSSYGKGEEWKQEDFGGGVQTMSMGGDDNGPKTGVKLFIEILNNMDVSCRHLVTAAFTAPLTLLPTFLPSLCHSEIGCQCPSDAGQGHAGSLKSQ